MIEHRNSSDLIDVANMISARALIQNIAKSKVEPPDLIIGQKNTQTQGDTESINGGFPDWTCPKNSRKKKCLIADLDTWITGGE